jgi:hypothetical protein
MNGWASVDLAPCVRCAVYVDTTELGRASDGHRYCATCLVAREGHGPRAREAARAYEAADAHAEEARDVDATDDWALPTAGPTLDRRAKLVAGAMLLVTLAFPIAACFSQL